MQQSIQFLSYKINGLIWRAKCNVSQILWIYLSRWISAKESVESIFLRERKNLEDDWMNLLTITLKRIIQICECQFPIQARGLH